MTFTHLHPHSSLLSFPSGPPRLPVLRPGRHPQRHLHVRLEPGQRRPPTGKLRCVDHFGRQSRVQSCAPKRTRPAHQPARTAPRLHRALRLPEGRRPGPGGRALADGHLPGRAAGVPGHGRPGPGGGPALAGGGPPGPRARVGRVQCPLFAPADGRGGLFADAESVRAVRAEPAVCDGKGNGERERGRGVER